ncbi:CDP-glycerol glycerophosphotransferase family protein [Aeromonas veronii]|uniref:CDP-glycerol glycerophosphotransferase family protein n=1 Tax=Aeromonas veronii TaxID=654 RepID=UPI001F31FFFC|nr:CDP-glycerol glycerophosphotransferase family protein [Aeromonas veronii]MCF5852619.1 CDP-glycerol glycerophosphotransferase family protein [Aeromonas veronii]
MSKFTKLLNTPTLFISDMLKKKVSLLNRVGLTNQSTSPTPKKNVAQAKKKSPSPVTVITKNSRLFSRIAHLLHTGEGMTHGPSHLELWVGEFISSKEEFSILVRDFNLYNWAVDKYPCLNIIYAKNPTDVEKVLHKLPFLKAIYYFSNTGNLIHTLRYNRYQHIFLGHGDSDKSASAHKFFRVYDEIWVAGQAHIDRFKNAGFNTAHIDFVKVGRPNLKHIIKTSIDNEIEIKNKISKVTYFPTWEGVYEENNYSSAHLSVILLSEIQRKLNCKISAKYHPVTGSRDVTLKNITTSLQVEFADRTYMLDVAEKSTPISNLIVGSDAFICDISAVVSECISSLSPIFIYIPTDRDISTSSSDMQYADYAYVFNNIPQLMELIDDVLINGNDYLKEARYKALDYLLSIDKTINDTFDHELQRVSADKELNANPRDFVNQ